jgi:dCMP deaminase
MNKQLRYDLAYMKMAQVWAQLSYSERKQVGALLVRDGQIISDGFNGTPYGFDNACELPNENVTRWEVLHAESNALMKCAKHGNSSNGATLYITYSPCKDCAKLIAQSGIVRVVYYEEYRDIIGLDFLRSLGITVEKIDMPNDPTN